MAGNYLPAWLCPDHWSSSSAAFPFKSIQLGIHRPLRQSLSGLNSSTLEWNSRCIKGCLSIYYISQCVYWSTLQRRLCRRETLIGHVGETCHVSSAWVKADNDETERRKETERNAAIQADSQTERTRETETDRQRERQRVRERAVIQSECDKCRIMTESALLSIHLSSITGTVYPVYPSSPLSPSIRFSQLLCCGSVPAFPSQPKSAPAAFVLLSLPSMVCVCMAVFV